jgi:hypothetical protein
MVLRSGRPRGRPPKENQCQLQITTNLVARKKLTNQLYSDHNGDLSTTIVENSRAHQYFPFVNCLEVLCVILAEFQSPEAWFFVDQEVFYFFILWKRSIRAGEGVLCFGSRIHV